MKPIGTKIDYYGMTLHTVLPYIATDENGRIFSYSKKPSAQEDCEGGYWKRPSMCREHDLAYVDLEGEDWRATLKQYDLEKGLEIA